MMKNPVKILNKKFCATKNGIHYEQLTDLSNKYKIIRSTRYHNLIKFINHNKIYKFTKQSKLFKTMKYEMDTTIDKGHGCKNPDECFIDEKNNKIFIIEKKFQQTAGSTCEKIQTSNFKLWQYSRTFPNYEIVYIYCLSRWFKNNCKAELTYLEEKKVPVFYGCEEKYKENIVEFIIEH
jgi:hypothetical protein